MKYTCGKFIKEQGANRFKPMSKEQKKNIHEIYVKCFYAKLKMKQGATGWRRPI